MVLSLTESAQQTAEAALRGQRGSVVALDVQTGEMVAMYSNPTFNPNGLAVHSTAFVQNMYNQINGGDKPALQRAYRELSPGSTFKVVTSVGDRGRASRRPTIASSTKRTASRSRAPTHAPQLRWRAVRRHLAGSLVHSCNTTFAQTRATSSATVPARDAAVRHRRARRRSTSSPGR